jgi:hypothetical protein
VRRNLSLIAVGGLVALIVHAGPDSPPGQAQAAAALAGRVSSAKEGPMEGVVVSAKNSTSPVTFRVGSNHGASIIKLEPLD